MNFYELNKIVILTFALYAWQDILFILNIASINCIIVQICGMYFGYSIQKNV